MEWWQAILLGLVQGLTEFLPVSSSGHLMIFKELLGVDGEGFLDFTVTVHLATVLSTILVFWAAIRQLLKGLLQFRYNDETDYIAKICVSMIPVFVVGMFFKDQVESLFGENLTTVAVCLLVTGALLFFSDHIGAQLLENARSLWRVGFLQRPDLIWNAIGSYGTVYLCSAPLLLLGLWLTLRDAFRKGRTFAKLLLLYWLCSLLLGLCVNGVNVNRLNILFYAQILLIVRGMEGLLSFRRQTAIALLGCYGLLAGMFFTSYFGPWAERMETVFYQDFLSAVSRAGELDGAQYVITPDTQSPGSGAVSEILTLYALQIDAKYYRGETDDPLPYAQRYQYRNPDPAALEDGTVYVVKESFPVPEGWISEDFGDYRVLRHGD